MKSSENLEVVGLRSIFFIVCREAIRVLMMRQDAFLLCIIRTYHRLKCSDRTVDLGSLQS